MVESYESAFRVDLRRVFVGIGFVTFFIAILSIIQTIFNIDRSYNDILINLIVFGLFVWIFTPMVRHLLLQYKILRDCSIVADNRTKLQKRLDTIAVMPWWLIFLGIFFWGGLGYLAIHDGLQGWKDGVLFTLALGVVARSVQLTVLKVRSR